MFEAKTRSTTTLAERSEAPNSNHDSNPDNGGKSETFQDDNTDLPDDHTMNASVLKFYHILTTLL